LFDIIAFSGTDGSGKSTQIELLSQVLKDKGRKVKVVWARGGYTPIFSFLKQVLRMLSADRIPKSGASQSRSKMLERKSISSIWIAIATLDLLLFYGVYVRLLCIFNFTVICDRYIEDTRIDFERNFSDIFNSESLSWKILNWLLPTPKASFLLYIPVEVSLARSKAKDEPFPDTPETLSFRLKAYLDESAFSSNKYHKIDCQKSVSDIQVEIRGKLKELL